MSPKISPGRWSKTTPNFKIAKNNSLGIILVVYACYRVWEH